MKISEEYFNQLNPSYQKVIKELEQKLDEYEDDEAKSVKVMLEFSTMYLMPKEYWDDIHHDIEDFLDDDEILKQNALKAYYHYFFDFCYLKYLKDEAHHLHKTLNFAADSDVDDDMGDHNLNKSHLSFPHSQLNKVFYKIERESNRALPKDIVKLYQNSKKLYDKIRAVEDDVKEWFKLLCQVSDANDGQEIVIHNAEYRLGSNLLNTKLWKLYIEYLREHDPQEMLQVYSKYCRFFLDDAEMKEKYKQEVDKYGPVYVPWKNLFDFESYKPDDDKESERDKLTDQEETENDGTDEVESDSGESESETSSVKGPSVPKRFKPENKNHIDERSDNAESQNTNMSTTRKTDMALLCKTFYDTFQPQNFSFKKPIMSYILENANTHVLKKLHQTCKYFFDRKQTPICRRLLCSAGKTQFCEESLLLNYINNDLELNELLKDTIVTTTFNAPFISSHLVSSLISKLHRCDAKYIYIECDLSDKEIKFLLQSGNVIIFQWWNLDDVTNAPKLENITQYLPKIENLEIVSVEVNSQSFTTLLKQKFLSKIYSLYLHEIEGEAFKGDDFLEYCKQYRAEYFKLNMEFKENFPNRDVFVTNIKERIESEIDQKNTDIYIA